MSDSGVNPPTVSGPSGKPSRHQRSAAGMVGAMIITLLVIGGFVALRGFTRDQAEVEVSPVDYQDAVAAAADSGLSLVHPRELPDGWRATSVDLSRDESPAWAMGMLTDEGRFVGIRQEEESADDMAAVAIDKDAVEGDEVRLDSEVADTWTTWTDDGGDTGYAAELGDQTVLVYGSAPREDLTEIVALLQR
ncbi:DUF4245 domain-containing protein [Nocardioides sp. P5_C9_2]